MSSTLTAKAGVSAADGDPKMVEEVIGKLKSQGLFDQVRKECLADVDTKPAYTNLKQRVESYVSRFLSKQSWTPDLNKNQLRESLRRHINQSGMLASGVERIIDQVINPKIFPLIKPKVDEMVCNYLGIDPEERLQKIEQRKLRQQQRHMAAMQQPGILGPSPPDLMALHLSGSSPMASGHYQSYPQMQGWSPSGGAIPTGPGPPVQPFSQIGGQQQLPSLQQPQAPPPMLFPGPPASTVGMLPNTALPLAAAAPPVPSPLLAFLNQRLGHFTTLAQSIFTQTQLFQQQAGLAQQQSTMNTGSMAGPVSYFDQTKHMFQNPPPLPPPAASPYIMPPMPAEPPTYSQFPPPLPPLPDSSTHLPPMPAEEEVLVDIPKTKEKPKKQEREKEKDGTYNILKEIPLPIPLPISPTKVAKPPAHMPKLEDRNGKQILENISSVSEKTMHENNLIAKTSADDIELVNVDDEDDGVTIISIEHPAQQEENLLTIVDVDQEETEDKKRTSSAYNFQWDEDVELSDISDISCSSIHTSDLSSFEGSEDEDEEQEKVEYREEEKVDNEFVIEEDIEKDVDHEAVEKEGEDMVEVQQQLEGKRVEDGEMVHTLETNLVEEVVLDEVSLEKPDDGVVVEVNVLTGEETTITMTTAVDSAIITTQEEEVEEVIVPIEAPQQQTSSEQPSVLSVPEQIEVVLEPAMDIAIPLKTSPVKPQRLISLRYNYSDSDGDETRDERKQRIAQEKEQRYSRRQQRRAELEAKRREKEEERARIREEKRLLKAESSNTTGTEDENIGSESKPESTEDENPVLPSATPLNALTSPPVLPSTSPLNVLTSPPALPSVAFNVLTSPNKSSPDKRKKTKEQLKEELREQKMQEKKRFLRRQRTRNRKYTSDDFTSIFTEKRQLFSSESYAYEEEVNTSLVVEDGAVVMDTDDVYITSPPTPTQDEPPEGAVVPEKNEGVSMYGTVSRLSPVASTSITETPATLTVTQVARETRSRRNLSEEQRSLETISTGRADSPFSDVSGGSLGDGAEKRPSKRCRIGDTSPVSSESNQSQHSRDVSPIDVKTKSSDVPSISPELASRRRRQIYSSDDLYKPMTTHRRRGSPIASLQTTSRRNKQSLSPMLLPPPPAPRKAVAPTRHARHGSSPKAASAGSAAARGRRSSGSSSVSVDLTRSRSRSRSTSRSRSRSRSHSRSSLSSHSSKDESNSSDHGRSSDHGKRSTPIEHVNFGQAAHWARQTSLTEQPRPSRKRLRSFGSDMSQSRSPISSRSSSPHMQEYSQSRSTTEMQPQSHAEDVDDISDDDDDENDDLKRGQRSPSPGLPKAYRNRSPSPEELSPPSPPPVSSRSKTSRGSKRKKKRRSHKAASSSSPRRPRRHHSPPRRYSPSSPSDSRMQRARSGSPPPPPPQLNVPPHPHLYSPPYPNTRQHYLGQPPPPVMMPGRGGPPLRGPPPHLPPPHLPPPHLPPPHLPPPHLPPPHLPPHLPPPPWAMPPRGLPPPDMGEFMPPHGHNLRRPMAPYPPANYPPTAYVPGTYTPLPPKELRGLEDLPPPAPPSKKMRR